MTNQVQQHHFDTSGDGFADGFASGCQDSILIPLYDDALQNVDEPWNAGFLCGIKAQHGGLPEYEYKSVDDDGEVGVQEVAPLVYSDE